jgi:hypothetical protein
MCQMVMHACICRDSHHCNVSPQSYCYRDRVVARLKSTSDRFECCWCESILRISADCSIAQLSTLGSAPASALHYAVGCVECLVAWADLLESCVLGFCAALFLLRAHILESHGVDDLSWLASTACMDSWAPVATYLGQCSLFSCCAHTLKSDDLSWLAGEHSMHGLLGARSDIPGPVQPIKSGVCSRMHYFMDEFHLAKPLLDACS